jgi:hypothetical protein
MRKITLAAITAATMLASTVTLAQPASARTGCATRPGYRLVHKGQTLATVARHLHSNGHKEALASSGGYRSMIRSYRTCSQYSAIDISFSANPGRALTVDAKSAVWIS